MAASSASVRPPPAPMVRSQSTIHDEDSATTIVQQVPDDAWRLLLQCTRARTVVPFVGAGISAAQLPTWEAALKGVWELTADERASARGAAGGAGVAPAAAAPSTADPSTEGATSPATDTTSGSSDSGSGSSDSGSGSGGGGGGGASRAATPALDKAAATSLVKASAGDGAAAASPPALERLMAAAEAVPGATPQALKQLREKVSSALWDFAGDADGSWAQWNDFLKHCGGLPDATEVMVQELPVGRFEEAMGEFFEDKLAQGAIAAALHSDEVISTPPPVASDYKRGVAVWMQRLRDALGVSEEMRQRLATLSGDEAKREVTAHAMSELFVGVEGRARLEEKFPDEDARAAKQAELRERVRALLGLSRGHWKSLDLHRSIVTGPWRFIVSTNWDDLLETAWEYLVTEHDTASKQPPEGIKRGHRNELPVRYRADVPHLFAEMKSGGVHAPRLFKSHGDWSERGRAEFVASHADYRKLMSSNAPALQFLRHLATSASILFYGCSLTDRDLLACLDDMVETYGSSSIGPHFWLSECSASERIDAATKLTHRRRWFRACCPC